MKKLSSTLLATLCVLALTACGGSGDNTASPSPEASATPSASATQTATPSVSPTQTATTSASQPASAEGFTATKAYNATTKVNDSIMVKLVDVTTDEATINAAIDAYDGIYDLSQKNESTQWVLITYDVMWPEGTELPDYGNTPNVRLEVTDGKTGKGGVVKYKGITCITSTAEIAKPEPLSAGQVGTFKAIAAIPENMSADEVVVQFGWEEYVLVDKAGKTFTSNN